MAASADNWEDIINLVTGFTLPARSDITGAKGQGGLHWLDVTIDKVKEGTSATGGPHPDGKGFDIYFYAGSGDDVDGYKATVTFTDQSDGFHYWTRSQNALKVLVGKPYTTVDARTDNDSAGDPSAGNAVDLTTFPVMAKSFDAAGTFFKNHTETLKQWAESLGDENAAWKGHAAGVFYHLVNDLHDTYDTLTADLIPPGFSPANTSPSTGYVSSTQFGDSIVGAEVSLHDALSSLNDHLTKFVNHTGSAVKNTHPDGTTTQDTVSGDTREVLVAVMNDIVTWVNNHNLTKVTTYDKFNPYGGYMGNPGAPIPTLTTAPGFSDTTTWGNLKDTATWGGAANEAIARWTANVQTNLDDPARTVIKTLQQSWSRVLNPNWDGAFQFSPGPAVSLASEYQKEEAAIEKAKADEANDKLNTALNNIGDGMNNFKNGLDNFGNSINNFGNNINSGLNHFGDSVGNLGDNLNSGLNHFGDSLGNNLNSGLHGLGNDFQTVGGGLNNLNDGLNHFGDNISNGLGGLGNSFTNGLGGLGNSFTNGLGGLGNLSNLFTGPNGPTGLLGPAGSFVPTPNSDLLTNTVDPALAGFRNSNGSTTTQNADGSVTTTYPDGSSTTVSPNGTVTSTRPDGSTTTTRLNPGKTLTNADGSTTALGSDGSITTHFPDGSTVTQKPDGSLVTTHPDGSTTTHFGNGVVETTGTDGVTHLTATDGTTMTQNPNGSVTSDFADGSHTTLSPDGTVTTTDASGHTVTSHLGNGQSLVNPDGSSTTLGGDGSMTTHYPDGSTVTVHPDGTVTTTDATGTGTGSGKELGGLGNESDLSGGGPRVPTSSSGHGGGLTLRDGEGHTTTHFPSGAVATTDSLGNTTTTFPDGSSTVAGPNGEFQTVPSPQTVAAAQAAAAGPLGGVGEGLVGAQGASPATDAVGLSGLASPMMMMMGMSRMGQQGQQREGERVRETYAQRDGDGAFIQGGSHQQYAPPPEDEFEEEDADPDELPSRTPTGGQGGRFGRGAAQRPSTQSSWSDGDDVWGTGEEGMPASLGR
ncbi:AAWKG family protein [Actinacidiphila acidipaludis]|uniref:AAWKG family protein n=1 Tax=Actinacidiphila acidipaludis TaxID=2873382 RepID=A0ABS7Q2N7_9ACTN|nr:AAWKG family protein [Streptomyces acidipaludis]MBY8877404.1 AAWKG family protein [Streptomyces acidipaludis]